ncbi:MAG: hypothetical protein ACFFAN_21055 [Promethearchaeota archaeon]
MGDDLDQQYQNYKFDRRLVNVDDWAIPALQDGNYSIFTTDDVKNGFFRHP